MIKFSKKPRTFTEETLVPRAKESMNCPKHGLAGAGLFLEKVLPTLRISLTIQCWPLPEAEGYQEPLI